MEKMIAITLLLSLYSYICAENNSLYKKCAQCHGEKGEKIALGKSKVINKMNRVELEAAMKGYKNGTYGGEMKGLMKAQLADYGDAQIAAVAAEIIRLK